MHAHWNTRSTSTATIAMTPSMGYIEFTGSLPATAIPIPAASATPVIVTVATILF